MPQTTTFNFATRLVSLPMATTTVADGLQDKAKKSARVAISVSNTSGTLGFLHANLIKVAKKYYLLAGPSGIGKSTYAEYLGQSLGAKVLANDWVAVERDGSRFYASDLNVAADMKHKTRCPLTGIVFLTGNDTLQRDAFAPNDQEWQQLLQETFDTATPRELTMLRSFWTSNKDALPLCCALPARQRSIAQTATLLCGILQRKRATARRNSTSVGVIGTGAVGTALAFQLGKLPYVQTVHLFNRTVATAKGCALDMNHATALQRRDDVFVAHDDAAAVFRNAAAVFLTFRDESATVATDIPERWQKFATHLVIIRKYAKLASRLHFAGTIFVVTNPVDILTYACHASRVSQSAGLYSHQLYGIGLETDAARVVSYARRFDPAFSKDSFVLYGNHSDEFALDASLSPEQLDSLLKQVRGASSEVRQFVPRTIYGPVDAAVRTYDAFVRNLSAHVTLVQEGAFMGREVNFRHGLPQLTQTIQGKGYANIIERNQQMAAACADIL